MLLTRSRPVVLPREAIIEENTPSARSRKLSASSPASPPTSPSTTKPSIREQSPSPPPATTVTVRTTNRLPCMTSIGPFPGELLLGLYSTDTRRSDHVIEVHYDGTSVVCDKDTSSTYAWMAYIQPARDRHEQNIESIRDSLGRIHFRCVRDIAKGEELFVWYGRDMAQQTDIPVLTPAHIRGHQEYTCTKCLRSFRYPNVLKAHMRFHCSRSNVTSGYGPLSSGIWQPFGVPPPAHVHPREKTERLSAKPEYPNGHQPFSASDFPSAFKLHRRPSIHENRSESTPRMQSSPDSVSDDDGKAKSVTRQKSPDCSPKANPGGVMGLDFMSSASDALNPFRPFFLSPYLDKMAPGLSHLNPMYSRLYASLPYGCSGTTPTSMPLYTGSLSDSAAALYQLYGIQPNPLTARQLSPSDKIPHSTQRADELPSPTRHLVSSSADCMPAPAPRQLPVSAFSYPMPSDKAGEPLDLLPKSLYTNKSRKGHLCIYCGKLYSRKYGLKIHLRTHTGYKPLKCKVCLRPFGDPSNLNKHIRLHAEGETPYRCQYCGKVLVRRRDLERHIRSRHPDGASSTADVTLQTFDDVTSADSPRDSSDQENDALNDSYDDGNHEIEVEV